MKLRLATVAFIFCTSAIVFAVVVLFSSRRTPAVHAFSEPSKGSTLAAPAPEQSARTQTLSFNDHVQPILSEHCFHCHGPDSDSRKGELRLDRAEFAFAIRKE